MVDGELEQGPAPAEQDLATNALEARYETVVGQRINGPQLEGLAPEWLKEALTDKRTQTVELADGVGWPLLVPIQYNQDYQGAFFTEHFPDKQAYFLSLPNAADVSDVTRKQIHEVLVRSSEEQGIFIHDSRVDGGDKVGDGSPAVISLDEVLEGSAFAVSDITPESQAFGMSYGKPRVSHYMATARHEGGWPAGDFSTTAAFTRLVEKGEYEPLPRHGPTVLTPELLQANEGQLLDDIWRVYSEQFEELVEDHPSLQIQPREELERMLLDDESFNVAYMDEGKVAALCYFVSNIEKCIWLNQAFYEAVKENTPGLKLAYFPGIVVDKDKARQGVGYVDEMIKVIERTYEEAGTLGMQIVFQCTNVSETYIPKIVTSVISNNGVFTFDQPPDESGSSFKKIAQYDYKVSELSAAQ